jgi:hypothetical protein
MTIIKSSSLTKISKINSGKCQTFRKAGELEYEVGKNTANELFIRITSYENEINTPCPHEWFSIFDLVELFIHGRGGHISKFEPFDDNSKPLQVITNNTASAFLKVILMDAIK